MRPPAAVLWDMDGTIVDTEPYWIAAEHEVVESFGGRWSDELARRCVGQPLPASARLIREHTPVDLPPEQIVDRLLASVIDATRARVPWRPGARELLRECAERGVPCALVTMSYRSFAQVLLDALPAGTFAAVVTGDMVTAGKPDPEAYATAARLLGADPVDCVAIEDSPTGARAAVAAGVPTVAVPHVVDVPAEIGAHLTPTLAGLRLADLVSLARGGVLG